MLLNKDKVGVGEEPVEDVEHLAHDGDESDHLRFAGRDEARVVGAQHVVVSGGGDGRHVEDAAHEAASTADVASLMAAATVARKGRDADQSRQLRGLDLAEFGEVSEHGGGKHGAGTFEFAQAGGFAAQGVVVVDVILDELVGGGQFLFQKRDLSVQAGAQDRAGQLQAVTHGDKLLADLPAVIEQFAQGDRGLIHRGVQAGLDFFAEAAEQQRVEPVGLGQQAFGVGEGAHAAGIGDADFVLGQQERRDDGAFVAVGRFADIIAVDGDPLANVRELESVDAVVKGGKIVN